MQYLYFECRYKYGDTNADAVTRFVGERDNVQCSMWTPTSDAVIPGDSRRV